MGNTIRGRLAHAWNAFFNKSPTDEDYYPNSGYDVYRPGRRLVFNSDPQTIVNSIYTRLAIDIASMDIKHVKVNEEGQFAENLSSDINDLFGVEANIDQSGIAFMLDVALSLFDEGCIALVPIDTTIDPMSSRSFKINSIRVGRIVDWYPKKVKVEVYNDNEGRNEEVIVDKSYVAIIENPLYSVMNEPNSTLQRLTQKLGLLDAIDNQSGSGKLDIIIQMPYSVRNDRKKEHAEERRKEIESQLINSKYGIAYTDGSEKVIQLNRPAENNLMAQVEYLTSMLYSQLGLTKEVFEGNADEKTMLNYYNRTIDPFMSTITSEVKRKFLTPTARTQNHSIMYFRNPFKLVSVGELAEITDKFTRNEVLTPNEVRAYMGIKPSKDPKADELRNRNINQKTGEAVPEPKQKPKLKVVGEEK